MEVIIDPQLEICDAHHHLWNPPLPSYGPEQLLADVSSGHHVTSTILVEAKGYYRTKGPQKLRSLGETETGRRAADHARAQDLPSICAGIVASVDLRLGAEIEDIVQLHAGAAGGHLRGVRNIGAWHEATDENGPRAIAPKPGLYGDSAFREGFARLHRLGLSFDVWVYHTQLPDVCALADAFPDQAIMLDHMGTPLGVGSYAKHRHEVFHIWCNGLRETANRSNVSLKLGGLGLRPCGWTMEGVWPRSSIELAEIWRPYIDAAIEIFGVDRCCFGSNFPVDRVAATYGALWNTFKRITAGYSPEERSKLFHDNATAFYRIQPSARD